jgi:CubicO group peptidase (beta-lactamase class C family)
MRSTGPLAPLLVSFALAAFAATAAIAAPAQPAADRIEWPGTPLARRAQAYFAQLAGSEDDARRFFTEHLAPSALAEADVPVRLERRRVMLERTGGVTPLEVVGNNAMELTVRGLAGNGDAVVVIFRAEPEPPHRLLGVAIEARAEGPGEPRLVPSAGPPLEDAEVVERMREHLDARAAAGEFSGVALLAHGSTTLLAGAWGLADRERSVPVTEATRFNLGSIGKMFTRTAVAQLAESGRLSLDDPLSKYLPDFPHADSITLDMLCEHRSGVGDFFGPAFDAMDHSRLRHNRDYLSLFRDQPLWFTPGTSQRYSNGGYVLLGEVIARASGQDYYEYLAKQIFGPAGMTATGAPVEGDGTAGLARGYTHEGAVAGKERDNQATRPARGSAAGGSYSTAADLLAFDRALFAGRLCSPAWAAWIAGGPRPVPGATTAAESPMAGFAGGAPGVACEWVREGDVTLIVLTNRDPGVTKAVMQPIRELVARMKTSPRP